MRGKEREGRKEGEGGQNEEEKWNRKEGGGRGGTVAEEGKEGKRRGETQMNKHLPTQLP